MCFMKKDINLNPISQYSVAMVSSSQVLIKYFDKICVHFCDIEIGKFAKLCDVGPPEKDQTMVGHS